MGGGGGGGEIITLPSLQWQYDQVAESAKEVANRSSVQRPQPLSSSKSKRRKDFYSFHVFNLNFLKTVPAATWSKTNHHCLPGFWWC